MYRYWVEQTAERLAFVRHLSHFMLIGRSGIMFTFATVLDGQQCDARSLSKVRSVL